MSVHRDIFGPKGMLAFAPRFFKNKNLRKMSSAKPQPRTKHDTKSDITKRVHSDLGQFRRNVLCRHMPPSGGGFRGVWGRRFLGRLSARSWPILFRHGQFLRVFSAWRSCSSHRKTFASAFFILAVAESGRAPGLRGCSSWLSRSSRKRLFSRQCGQQFFEGLCLLLLCPSLL